MDLGFLISLRLILNSNYKCFSINDSISIRVPEAENSEAAHGQVSKPEQKTKIVDMQ